MPSDALTIMEWLVFDGCASSIAHTAVCRREVISEVSCPAVTPVVLGAGSNYDCICVRIYGRLPHVTPFV